MFPHLEEKMIFRILKKLQKTDEDTDTCILERVIDYFLKTEVSGLEYLGLQKLSAFVLGTYLYKFHEIQEFPLKIITFLG